MLTAFLSLLAASCIRYDEKPPLTFFKDDPGAVQFKLVLEEAASREQVIQARGGEIRGAQEIIVHPTANRPDTYYLVNKSPDLDGAAIESAEFKNDDSSGGQVLMVTFKPGPGGADKMGRLTETNLGKKLAIIVAGRVVSAPVIQSRVAGEAQITGLSQEEINKLSPP